MLRRFRLFADNLLTLSKTYGLSGELIVVEWNPPPGPRLHDVLQVYAKSDEFPIRYIEVPPEVHASLRNSDVLPLFQMIAKNVGIRRAHGEFICATNQDILFSDQLIEFLASADLNKTCMYRCDRTDVRAEVPEDLDVRGQVAWCRKNIIRVNGRYGTFRVPWWNMVREPRTAVDLVKLIPEVLPGMIARLNFRRKRRRKKVSSVLEIIRRGLQRLRWGGGRLLAALGRLLRGGGELLMIPSKSKLHTNACGDFTLLAREHWFALGGYPELALYSLHVDSLFCSMAEATGLREVVLHPPNYVFHMEHGSSWAIMTPEEKLRWFSIKPWVDYGMLCDIQNYMARTAHPIECNSPNWGFGDLNLMEIVIGCEQEKVAQSALSTR